MRAFLERLGGFLPAAIALALPVVYIPTITGFPSAVDSFILPRASIVVVGACVGTGLALVVGSGPKLGSLRWPLVAAAAAAVLALVFSVSWPVGIAGSYTRYESLPVRLSYLGFLASTVWLLRTRLQRELVTAAFVFGTAIASFEAFFQLVGQAPYRPDGNLGNANLLAALIAMAAPLALARATRWRSYFVVAWWVTLPMLGLGLYATTSRSGVVGALAGCVALGAFTARRLLTARRRLVAAIAIASLAVTGLAVVAIAATPLSRLNDDPPSLRLHLWLDGLRMIGSRPLTGWGLDTTGLVFGQFLSHNYAELVTFDRVHDGPLDIAATQGVIGLAALAWVLVLIFRRLWRDGFPGDSAPLAAALIAYSVWVLFNFDWAPATGAFWLLAGAAWSAAGEVEPGTARATLPAAPNARAWRPLAAVALVLAAIAFGVLPVLADSWYYSGRADLSVEVDPLQPRYHWSLGDALVAEGKLQDGVVELRRAADFGESEPALYVDLGDVEVRLGRTADARAAYRRALEIDPFYSPAAERLSGLGG